MNAPNATKLFQQVRNPIMVPVMLDAPKQIIENIVGVLLVKRVIYIIIAITVILKFMQRKNLQVVIVVQEKVGMAIHGLGDKTLTIIII